MKKRLALLSIMLCALFGFFACGEDPYASLKIESSAQDVVLTMEEVNVNGVKEYTLNPYEFYVTVSGAKSSVSTEVEVSGGEGLVTIDTEFRGEGKTKITVTPITHEKTGPFSLTVRTAEGNKSLNVNFNLNLQIKDFTFKEDNLKVVAKGGELNLYDLDKYLKFTPELTNQRYISFEIVTPVDNAIPNREGNYNYESNGKYAEIVDGVLKTYKTNASGEPVVYPQLTTSVSAEDGAYDETYQCITLKAKYVGNNAGDVKITDKYIDIEVVEDCSDVLLYMNHQQNTSDVGSEKEGYFQLERNSKGEYDIVLLDPLYKYGINFPTYYIERDLLFDFGQYSQLVGYKPDDYRVVCEQVLDTDNMPITLTGIRNVENNNQFKVLAQSAGRYSHVFRIEHKDYPDIINSEVVVNFYVQDLPTEIKINGTAIQDSYTVYDYYSSGTQGTKFNVNLNNNHGNFKYFVFVKDAALAESINLYKGSEVGKQALGILTNEGGEDVIISAIDGREVTRFANLDTFYLTHSFGEGELPAEPIEFCIGIMYSVAADDYSDEVKNYYFKNAIMYVSTDIIIENGIRDINFTQSKYMVDLTNPLLTNDILDGDGIKLFDLPEGQAFDSAIPSNGLEYNSDLIAVYPVEGETKTSVYMKCNSDYVAGKTSITVRTRNGIVRKVDVETFIPTVYTEGADLPLGMYVDKNQTLYYMSDPIEHNKMFNVYKDGEIWGESFTYMSIDTLFMLNGTSVDIRFFDYLLTFDDAGNKTVIPMDITGLVKVEFNYKNYASYSKGSITAHKITENIDSPVIMEITYVGGVLTADEEGNSIYTPCIKKHRVEIFIYLPLQGVQVKNEKDTTIYVDDSLGVYSKELSSHTIISDFIPNEIKLGAAWNEKWADMLTEDGLPVTLFYDYKGVLNSIIYLNNNQPLTITSFSGKNSRVIRYSDLFKVSVNDYTCTIKSIVDSECECKCACEKGKFIGRCECEDCEGSLMSWLIMSEVDGGGGYLPNDIDSVIKNKIFNNDIYFRINVYIRQFFKLQNINEVSIKAEYATKISEYNLDIFDDGVYFENRGSSDELKAIVPYAIESGLMAPDKEFVIIPGTKALFRAEVTSNPSGNSGEIVVKGGDAFGEDYLTITPRDNIKSVDENGKYSYFNYSLVKSIRVKIANGTIEAPFEIRNVADFEEMQQDIIDKNYYYYILTNNVNLSKVDILNVSFEDVDSNFNLTGRHSYYRDGVEIVKYSSFYNMNIRRDIELTYDNYVGLFGKLTENVMISNISLVNANITLNIVKAGDKKLYVGALAGYAHDAQIVNSSVSGIVRINNGLTEGSSQGEINVGGLVGAAENVKINGLPGNYQAGISNSEHNVNVSISVQEDNLNNYNIGGLLGYNKGITSTGYPISNINVVSTIDSKSSKANIGGVIGLGNTCQLHNLEVYPKITATNTNGHVNVGGIMGQTSGVPVLTNSKIYFVKNSNSVTWKDTCDIYVNSASGSVNVGGLIGDVASGSAKISYTYLRSFYNYNISNNYKGNIYVIAGSGNVGGLIGSNSSSVIISNSYFDGDMSVLETLMGGMLIGKFTGNTNIQNSYAIGYLYSISADEKLSALTEIAGDLGVFGGISYKTGNLNGKPLAQVYDSANLTIDNVYAVANNSLYYLGELDIISSKYKVCAVNGISDDLKTTFGISSYNNLGEELFKNILQYNVKISESDSNEDPCWLWANGLNVAGDMSLPILMGGNGKALFDVLPESIVVERITESHGFYNITDTGSEVVQILMYVNSTDKEIKNDYYEITVDESGAIKIVLNGKVEVFTSLIEINGDIVITEESDRSAQVVLLEGNKIYPKGEGVSTITIASALDNSIYTEIIIKVVKGITGIELYDETTTSNKTRSEDNHAYVYVDEETTFSLKNINIIDGDEYFALTNTIYKLEVLSSDSENIININNVNVEVNDVLFISTNSFVVKGVDSGSAVIKITPCIVLDGIVHSLDYLEMGELAEDYIFTARDKTKSITLTEKPESLTFRYKSNFSIEVETSDFVEVSEGVYTTTEKIRVFINSVQFELDLNNPSTWSIDYELVNFVFTNLTSEVSSSYENCRVFTLSGYALLDAEFYRKNAEDYDLNVLRYFFTFIPETNLLNNEVIDHNIADSIEIRITPTPLQTIDAIYYSKGELLLGEEDDSFNPAENESNNIIPGRYGLLKITLDEEFTDSSYISITLNNKYSNYIKLYQVAGEVPERVNADGNYELDPNGEITGYKEITSTRFYPLEYPSEYGLKLSKISLNHLDGHYFNKTYFVKVFMTKDYTMLNDDKVVFNIRSYNGNDLQDSVSIQKVLKIMELPTISVKVDNELSANLGLGTKKPLDITYKGVENDINVNGLEAGIVLLDENDNIVNTLDIDYLNEGKKYYIYADITNDEYKLNSFELKFITSQFIENVLETATCNLNINVVDFEIEKLTLSNSINNRVTIKHGQDFAIAVDIDYRELFALNNSDLVEKYREIVEDKVRMIEYAMAGTSIIGSNNESILTSELRLYYQTYVSGHMTYRQMTTKTVINYVALREGLIIDQVDGTSYKYYVIKGIAVNNEENLVNLRISLPYAYTDGVMSVNAALDNLGYEIDFEVLVENSSTEDNPIPIETQQELLEYANTSGDYILLNDITLTDWVPQNAIFDSLDGNGYVITIESFDLSSMQKSNNVNVGIFSTVSETTLLKNITIDISKLLVSEDMVGANLNNLAKSTQENYTYDTKVDIAYSNNVNFGILAGTNNGAITNAKVINFGNANEENIYLHILTTQGYLNNDFVISKIGGLVGVNSATGAITNSYVGLNIATSDNMGSATITHVMNPSKEILNNADDDLGMSDIYGFTIAGGNIIGGMVADNIGIVSNSYVKGLGVYNTYSAVDEGKTGGFVATNSNKVTSAFAEGAKILDYRAVEDKNTVESTGHVGGFVYENTGSIENAYSNVVLATESSFIGGFVYNNSGKINNSYTTTINRNNLAHGQFTGVAVDGRSVLNSGEYINCYYLVLGTEHVNKYEDAIAIENENSPINEIVTWQGFSFSTTQNVDGIWQLEEGYTPRLAGVFSETLSFRRLTAMADFDDVNSSEDITVYSYSYVGNGLGSKNNPLIISAADDFHAKIIDYSVNILIGDKQTKVFGAVADTDNVIARLSAIKYVRLVNNLNFDNKVFESLNGYYLQNLIFAGVLDGNGMSMSNINISAIKSNETKELENFGLFSQIGLHYAGQDVGQSVIKNLNISVKSYTGTDVNNAGILAGTIVNTNVINVSLDGGNVEIIGRNTAGALAGVIKAEGDNSRISLYDIQVTNVVLESSYGSLKGEITADTEDNSGGIFKKFIVKNVENTQTFESSFETLYNATTKTSDLSSERLHEVSYTGAVAGVVVAGNYNSDIVSSLTEYATYKSGVVGSSSPIHSTINNVVVSGSVQINTADNAGGLFGYVGENTIVKNSKFIISTGQLIKGDNYVGGIVGENHGVIDECSIALPDEEQILIDNSLVNPTANVHNHLLFDIENSNHYTVAVGGIAGYSSNGVIIDSYSKANVIKDNAFIAGGIVGYTENYNYIAYTYNSSVVYGKYVIGGIVGMQTNDQGGDTLHMYNVVSLTNWNVQTTTRDIRQIITSRLYDAQKELYESSENTNFYVKMPEIGNYNVKNTNTNTFVKTYSPKHFVGSVIGSMKVGVSNVYDPLIGKGDNNSVDSATLDTSNFVKVYSATLGLFSTTGTLESGTRNDSYANSFSYKLNDNTTINMYSYRIAYNVVGGLNEYGDPMAGYSDNYSFDKIFTSQEYIHQLLGKYYTNASGTSVSTTNVFKSNGENDNRFNIFSDESFDDNSVVWYITNNLPAYSNGLYASSVQITTDEELESALTSGLSGVTYKLMPTTNNTLNGKVLDGLDVQYARKVSNVFVGVNDDSGNMPKVVFDLSSKSIGTIFNYISGATFENIEFEIKGSYLDIDRSTYMYGILANIIENSTIKNCKFTINITNISNMIGFENINTFGLLFGEINNTIFFNNTVEINLSSLDISLLENMANFGTIAGKSSSSTISNNAINVTGDNLAIKINTSNQASINIGGVVGQFNNSTYSGNTTNFDVEITDNSTSIVNASALIGMANNSSINNIIHNKSLDYGLTSIKDNANIGLIVGKTYGVKMSTISTDTNTELKAELSEVNVISVGGIVGCNDGSLVMNYISGNSKVSASGTANALSVGGLVGYSNGLLRIDDSYSKNSISGTNAKDGSKVEQKITYTYTSVGGLIGLVSMSAELHDVYSITKVGIDTSSKLYTTASAGGLVGRATGNVTIINFAALNDFETSNINSDSEAYISGVIGLNNGLFTGEFGYSYVELPGVGETSSITNNSISTSTNNVYYAQEFVGNNYASDSMFTSFAMADLYEVDGMISQYAKLVPIFADGGLSLVDYGTIQLILPTSLSTTLGACADTEGSSRFTPKEFNSQNLANYNVILEDITAYTIGTLNGVISGRSTQNGKVTITGTSNPGSLTTTYEIVANNGVISNVYLNVNNSNMALVQLNNGLITNVYVYGITYSKYPIALVNSGRIYESATSVVYMESSNASSDIFGLVDTNLDTGKIANCYSSSFGYSASHEYITNVYGFANENRGNISNSFYFINEWMLDDNKLMKGVKTSVGGSISSQSNSLIPSFASKNSAVWTTENGHAQIKGIKDIPNQIDVIFTLGDIKGIDAIKSEIMSATTGKDSTLMSATFDYELKFYSENPTPYNVIRIDSGSEFTDYISSLSNNIVPENTIILICKTITVSKITKFSIPSTSALIGLSGVSINFAGILNTELITYNNGLIAGISFGGTSEAYEYKMVFKNDNVFVSYFAPIGTNRGILFNVYLANHVDGGESRFTIGVLKANYGYVYNVTHNTSINASKYFCKTYYSNSGVVYKFERIGVSWNTDAEEWISA